MRQLVEHLMRPTKRRKTPDSRWAHAGSAVMKFTCHGSGISSAIVRRFSEKSEVEQEKVTVQLVAEYANVVGRYGPDSDQVREFRKDHAANTELMEYADALDRIKRNLGGSGCVSETPTPR
jgi:hypothetical protein